MMKKHLLAAALLLSAAPAIAQDEAGESRIDVRKLRFGAFAAPTISWMRPTTNTDDQREFAVQSNGSVVGFMWGLMVDYNFAPNYALATGLQYNSTGGKILANTTASAPYNNNTVQSADFTYRVAYAEAPLHLKLRTDDINKFRFFGQLGVTAGVNIGKKADYSVLYTDNGGVQKTATGDDNKIEGGIGDIAPVMLQLNVGAGTEYAIGEKLSAYLGIFFNNGFVPDATNPQDFELNYSGEFRDGNTRLNNVALKLGLFF